MRSILFSPDPIEALSRFVKKKAPRADARRLSGVWRLARPALDRQDRSRRRPSDLAIRAGPSGTRPVQGVDENRQDSLVLRAVAWLLRSGPAHLPLSGSLDQHLIAGLDAPSRLTSDGLRPLARPDRPCQFSVSFQLLLFLL
jgi:hypothetical protein